MEVGVFGFLIGAGYIVGCLNDTGRVAAVRAGAVFGQLETGRRFHRRGRHDEDRPGEDDRIKYSVTGSRQPAEARLAFAGRCPIVAEAQFH